MRRVAIVLVLVACGGGGGEVAKSPSSPASSSSPSSPSAPVSSKPGPAVVEDDPPPPAAAKGDPNGKIEIVTASQYGRLSLGSEIVVDETHLYWASAGVGISRLAKSASSPAEVIAPLPREESVTAIAAGATHIAWATNDSMKPGHAAIHVRDSKSGAITTVAKNLGMPIAMTVDHAHVYFATMGGVAGDSPTPEPGTIRRARLSTGAVEVVQRGVDGATSLVVDATHLYTISARTSTGYADVIRVPKRGGNGPIETLAKAQDTPIGLAIDDQFVYFATSGPMETPPAAPCKSPPCPVATSAPVMEHGSVRRVSKTARDQVPTTIAIDLNSPKVVGANAVFVVFQLGSGIFTLPKAGGKPLAPIKLLDWSMQRLAQVSFEGFTYVPREDKIYVIGRRKEN
jgi:hypothetical protein